MQVYLVGGAVRDELLGRKVTEHDYVVVGSTPEHMLKTGFTQVGRDFPVFLHPKTKEEYALARTERKQGQGYTGFICDFSPDITLEEDLGRRDLTINAIAKAEDGSLIDPYGGQVDLNQRLIRHVSEAFSEDPLRILRVARFTARYRALGFVIADDTRKLITSMVQAGELNTLTIERVWLECEKSIKDGEFATFLALLNSFGALGYICSAIASKWSDTVFEKIEKQQHFAHQHHYDSEVSFAVLAHWLSSEEIEELAAHLKLPNQQTLALNIYHELNCDGIAQLHPEAVASVFNTFDLYRRPERFSLLMQLYDTLHIGNNSVDTLSKAFELAKGVTAKAFIDAGLKGPQIKEAIDTRRAELIARALKSESE
ncbi:tRNA nucleotidyltransferase [Pseudoalteromonas xiamenensis]